MKTTPSTTRSRRVLSPEAAYDQYERQVRESKRLRKKTSDPHPDSPPTATFGFRPVDEWEQDCFQWRGMVLTGRYAHWCMEWDDLPVDETCPEWPCNCGIVEDVDAGE